MSWAGNKPTSAGQAPDRRSLVAEKAPCGGNMMEEMRRRVEARRMGGTAASAAAASKVEKPNISPSMAAGKPSPT